MNDDNLWRKIEAKIKPIYLVAFFVLLLLFAFWKEAEAGEVTIEVGPTFLSGEFAEGGALLLSERFGRYSVGIGYISEQWVTPRVEDKTFVMENVLVQGTRHVAVTERFEISLGVAYFNSTSRALGSEFEFALGLTWRFSEHWQASIRHWSNAGSARPNMGQDAIVVGYTF